ncbi:MAG: hypothetical protein K0S06_2665 [Microvirga sp.]|jgi:hypothetical protein|nr:hypothetical protein [Microvirga sp.]
MHWIFAVVSLVAALSASAPARSQGVAVNPSAAASDVRNPSSFNPAAAASDIRNPSATNPAAAASDLRQPGLTSPGAPSAIRRPTAPRLVGPPERPPRKVRTRRGTRTATKADKPEKEQPRKAVPSARPSPAERKASEIMGSVCRGC